MSDFLPPIVTKLDGDLSGLAKAFAEAEAMAEQYGKDVEKRLSAAGRDSGRHMGEELGAGLKEETDKPSTSERPLDGLTKKVKEKFDQLGKDSGKAFADSLMAETKQVQDRMSALADEMMKTGNFDLMKDFKSAQGDLKILTKVKSEFDGVRKEAEKLKADLTGNGGGGLLNFALDELLVKGAKAGLGFLKQGLDGISGWAPTGMVQWLVAGAVAAAPAIGAAVNAALLLGVGAGGLALGIMGAIQDPRVKATWGGFFDFVKSGLGQASRGFVDPMIDGAIRTRAVFSQLMTQLQGGLDKLAPSFGRLLDGALGLVQKMMPGFLAALAAAGPLLDQLAQDLPLLGQYLSVFFQEMADGSPGAITFFHDLINLVGFTLVAFGGLTQVLSQVYDFFRNNPLGQLLSMSPAQALFDLAAGGDKTKSSFQELGKETGHTATQLGEVAYAASQAAMKADDLSTAIGKLVTQELTSKSTHLGFNQSLLDLKKSVEQNGVALDDHSEKGIANETAILRMAAAAEADRQSIEKQTGDVGAATAVFDAHMQQVYDTAAALGFDKEKVDALIGSVRTIPHQSQTDIQLKGIGMAEDDIREFKRSLLTVPTRIDTYFVQHFTSIGTPYAPGHGAQASASRYGGVMRHAATGLIDRPGIYEGMGDGMVVAAERETKREGFVPEHGITRPEAYSLLSEMASWHDLQVTASGGGSAAGAGSGSGGGGYSGPPVHVHVDIDGQAFYERVVIPAAQRAKDSFGSNGLG